MHILTHADSDGICCASLIKMTKKYKNAEVIFTHPSGISHDLRHIKDDVIICDIAIDRTTYNDLYSTLEHLTNDYSVLYIDHHPIPRELPSQVLMIHNLEMSATELVYRYFYQALPAYATHMAIIGAICDYFDQTPLMRELLLGYERRTIYLDAGILAQGLKTVGSSYDKMRVLVEKFSKGMYPCEIKDLVEGALSLTRKDKKKREKVLQDYEEGKHIAWVVNPKASRSKAAHWVLGEARKQVGLTLITHKNKPKILDITLRARPGIDLRKFLPDLAMRMGGSGGGHAHASGCRIPLIKKNTFLRSLDEIISELPVKVPPKIEQLVYL